jgi:hypothetical protein
MSYETSRGTERAFVAFVCRSCPTRDHVDVVNAVRAVVRHCPLGVLAESKCILGGSPCAMSVDGDGVIVAVQPSMDEVPVGRALVRGPLTTNADLTEFCFWLESGMWS